MDKQYNPFSLEGKNILITGASSGIGRQCAIDCSKMGARVVLLGRNEERLKETQSKLEGNGHKIISFDLTNLEQIQEMVSRIVARSGSIDGLVNCAGISATLPFKLTSPEKMNLFFKTNVFATIELTRHVLNFKNVNKKGASVIFIASVMGCVGENAKSLYSLTKGSLISGCRSLAIEYAPKNIRINVVSPGVVETDINRNQPYLSDPEKRNKTESYHPLGLGTVNDISNACIYLLSDASRWVTGQNLIVDGGYTIK